MRKYFIDSVFLGPRLCFHLLETAGGLLFKVTRLRMETQWSSRVEVNRKVAPYVSDPVGGGIWMMSDAPLYLAAPHSDPQVLFFLHQKMN